MNSILVKIGPQYKIFKRIYQDLMRGCFMGGTLQGLPEDEDERSKACVQLAIIALLSDGKTSLEFNVDEMAEAISVPKKAVNNAMYRIRSKSEKIRAKLNQA